MSRSTAGPVAAPRSDGDVRGLRSAGVDREDAHAARGRQCGPCARATFGDHAGRQQPAAVPGGVGEEQQSVVERPRLRARRAATRRREGEGCVGRARPRVQVDAVDSGARHLEERVRGPERRGEGVAYARNPAAGRGVHLGDVDRGTGPPSDRHHARDPGGEPAAGGVREQPAQLHRASRVPRTAVERVGVRAEGADAPALVAQDRAQRGVPRHPGETAGAQCGIASQPGREQRDVALYVRCVAPLVIPRSVGNAADDHAAGTEAHAARVKVGLVADLDGAQRPARQRGADGARERQRARGVAGGQVDADRHRRAPEAGEPGQAREPAIADEVAHPARARPEVRRAGGPPRLVAGVAADPQRDG